MNERGKRELSLITRFTLRQLLKAKANRVLLVFLLLIGLAAPPVYMQINKTEGTAEEEPGTEPELPQTLTVYLLDEDGMAGSLPVEGAIWENIRILPGQAPAELPENFVQAYLPAEEYGYSIRMEGPEQAAEEAAHPLEEWLRQQLLEQAGLSERDWAVLEKGLSVSERKLGEEDDTEDFEEAQMGIQIDYAAVLMMISIISASIIMQSIVEEKTSKLVETVMVDVRPENLIFGKICGVLVFTLIQILIPVCAALLSYFVSARFMDPAPIKEMLGGVTAVLSGLNVGSVLILILFIIPAILLFSFIAGAAGAGCSTMEDLSGATAIPMLPIMFAYMVSVFAVFLPASVLRVLSVIPVLSAFIAPIQYLSGAIGLPLLLAAWLIQFGCCICLAKLSGKVYRDLLLYKGSRRTVRDILKMAAGKEARQ